MEDQILEQLDRIEQRLQNQLLYSKEILTFKEFCTFCGLSESYGYKLTSLNKVPFYKPGGKLIYFKRSELEEWMLRNPIKTEEQLEEEAMHYLSTKCRKW
ncbi:helix-turn-helix transcriptional regulator [Flavilitoribacter nigricans]|uniref:DNA-binding protein n=1 Tax=Flavilitoribacter nigricans (strain ATCC 23147 / DSM 23189 / NBRC 102662 / NCIMB 1420 / SS-2) TaxID=1122177 RepID=A0A2D0NJK7_FLAN2|nr:helix-turn-helix domain-containing protein [Flavilitoribacter nigricans]PHN08682.1 DNA-binding protein [Flavilitoribacter nigricans DSM 23189 = NBRC 102662]